ncbi:DEAD/DEAH box helicase, partial [Candidatus Peregrinibacteria bacterium]|nr:DEAD/DEAH box helicase [Candidatus Peregrinibacteria bacterium]
TLDDARQIIEEVEKRRGRIKKQLAAAAIENEDWQEEIDTFPDLQEEFQQKYPEIDDSDGVNRLKNTHRQFLLKTADYFAARVKQKLPGTKVALGGSLVADMAVGDKHDIDLRILLPEGSDSLRNMQRISSEIADILHFRQQRMIDGDQCPLKQGLVHRQIFNVPEVGEISVAILIRSERDYVGYGDFQRDLPKKERADYLKEKNRLLAVGDYEAYEHLKGQFYLKTRRWVARELGLNQGAPENLGNAELPVWRVMPQIIEHLKRENRVLITSETGSGKTTQIPQALYAEGFGNHGLIIVVENRVVVTTEIARRVADEMEVRLGKEVGYHTRHDRKRSRDTKILFITSGGFRSMLRRDPSLQGVSVVLFDEFDERELSMDFSLALTEKAQQEGASVKFCLMSATLNAEKLKDHFGEIPSVVAKGRPFPVETHHSQDNVPDYEKPKKAAEMAASFHRRNEPGHILIFMPGKGEIDATEKELLKQKLTGVEIMPLHSQVTPQDRRRVFALSSNRKIIISTNIAERGVTIDGVTCVIDSGLVRQKQYDHASDTAKLPIVDCAQDSITQRAGRAGRTQPGQCFRLFSEYNSRQRRRETLPEIMRTPLREVILQIKAMGYAREASPISLPDSPDKIAWKTAKNQLRILGALDPEEEIKLSDVGLKLAELPCDPREGAMLLKAKELGCEEEVAIIVGIRTSRPLLYRPKNEQEEAAKAHRRFPKSNTSDLITQLKIFQEAERNRFNSRWCKENYVSWKALNEIRQNRDQLLRIVGGKRKSQRGSLDEEKIAQAILEGLPDHIWESSGGDWFTRYNLETDQYDRALLGRESGMKGARKIAASEVIEIPTRRGGRMKLITSATKVLE